METFVKIGHEMEKALPILTDCVMRILNSSAGDDAKHYALEALTNVAKIEGINITGCTFNGSSIRESKKRK